MTSGGNNINYFPDNQLTNFIAVPLPPKISVTQRASFPRRMDAPGPKVLTIWKWMVSFTTDTRRPYHSVDHSPNDVISSIRLFAGK